MRVYEISSVAKPPKSRFPEYAGLLANDAVWKFIVENGDFRGIPFSKWRSQTFYVDKPLYPRPNFFHIGVGVFVCDEKARELAAEPLEMSGEFLPIKVEGENGKFWIFNCTNCINAVHAKASKWRKFGPRPEHRMLERPAFISSRFGEECLFKIPEDRGTVLYCTERTGDVDDGEFKAVVENRALTGLEFKLVWTDKK